MSFSSEMSRFSEETQRRIERVVIGASFELSRKIIKRTPVGNPDLWVYFDRSTGQYVDYVAALGLPEGYTGGSARGNWQASINTPVRTETNEIDKTGAATIAEMSRVAQQSVGKVFYLTNNLPYINRLEFEGWSSQAPLGMVRISFAEMRRSLRDIIIRESRS